MTIQIEGATIKDIFRECELLSQCPKSCACGSADIRPSFQKAQDKYEYFYLKCGDCGKEFKFGLRKSDGELFPKFNEGQDGWCEPFRRSQQQEERGSNNSEPDGDDWD